MMRVHGGCRVNLGKHEGLKNAMTEAPDFAYKLLGDLLEQSMLEKEAGRNSAAVSPQLPSDHSAHSVQPGSAALQLPHWVHRFWCRLH